MEAIMNAPSHAHLPEEAIDCIDEARRNTLILLGNIIEPICAAVSVQLENCILQIHDENFTLPGNLDSLDASCSKYVSMLQRQSAQIQREILSRFTCKEVVIPRVKKMLHRLIEMFVRHCCLIRHFGDEGKLRLAADMPEVTIFLNQTYFLASCLCCEHDCYYQVAFIL